MMLLYIDPENQCFAILQPKTMQVQHSLVYSVPQEFTHTLLAKVVIIQEAL